MEPPLLSSFCFRLTLRTGCLLVGWYDIIYGHVKVLVYLVSMYSGYFHTTTVYRTALWLDFVFTILQLLGGVILVYGVKYKTIFLVLTSCVVGVVLMVGDVIDDVLLVLSFSPTPLPFTILAGLLLVTFVGMRGYITAAVYSYYQLLKEEVYLSDKTRHSIPDIVQTVT